MCTAYLQRRKSSSAAMIVMGMLVVGIMAGCSGSTDKALSAQQVEATPVQTPAGTSVAIASSPTPTLNYKEQFFAHVQETVVAERTALAGTPSWTPGIAQHPPAPTVTPVLGLFGTCGNKNTREPYIISCWFGILNGEYVVVDAGREGRAGDPSQGILIAYTHDLTQKDVLLTPDKAGAIQITAIDGTLFTLTTVDHQPVITYTFDLATRQWVSPNPGPSPSVSVSPMPSVSPLPTQQP
jgi:hypothetical protein